MTLRILTCCVVMEALLLQPVMALDISGFVSGEYRAFPHAAAYPQQSGNNFSVAAQMQFTQRWDGGRQQIEFTPFARLDQYDAKRTHADIRELSWLYAAEEWELRVGVRRVFWGVTESQHLVDIINQGDSVEGLDDEDKLGQPMINLALIQEWGTLDLFVLPYFRQRSFAGTEGRLRLPMVVDTDQTQYESAEREYHRDYAARWSHHSGDWDIGLSYFNGTQREPDFTSDGVVLIPIYNQLTQWGLDLQATRNSWLWKLEAIHRSGLVDEYGAATAGLEYSFYDINESGADLGLIAEYLYDERGEQATTPFANDIMLGLRLAMNDEQGTEALLGLIQDRENHSTVYSLEASRRFGSQWSASLESRIFSQTRPVDPLYALKQDDYVQLELAYYF